MQLVPDVRERIRFWMGPSPAAQIIPAASGPSLINVALPAGRLCNYLQSCNTAIPELSILYSEWILCVVSAPNASGRKSG